MHARRRHHGSAVRRAARNVASRSPTAARPAACGMARHGPIRRRQWVPRSCQRRCTRSAQWPAGVCRTIDFVEAVSLLRLNYVATCRTMLQRVAACRSVCPQGSIAAASTRSSRRGTRRLRRLSSAPHPHRDSDVPPASLKKWACSHAARHSGARFLTIDGKGKLRCARLLWHSDGARRPGLPTAHAAASSPSRSSCKHHCCPH
jgi:hypothetical protein